MPGKKVSNPKSKKVVKTTPKTEKPVKPAPVEPSPVDETVTGYAEEFSHLLSEFRSLQTKLKDLIQYTQKLEKKVTREQKNLQKKASGKRRRAPGTGQPSGFSKPGPVSDELRSFLNLKKDELIARTDVTKRINAYCKEHGLQGEKDKRVLKPDKALTKLLRIKKGDELTFFNLQKYMKVHFPNKEGVYPTA